MKLKESNAAMFLLASSYFAGGPFGLGSCRGLRERDVKPSDPEKDQRNLLAAAEKFKKKEMKRAENKRKSEEGIKKSKYKSPWS